MKKKILSLVFLAVNVSLVWCQSPRFSLYVDLGASRTYLTYIDSYANDYQKFHSTVGLGANLSIKIAKGLTFDPEIGLNAYGMNFLYDDARGRPKVISTLVLGYLQCSPMISIWPHRQFGVSGGFGVMASVFTVGSFDVLTSNNGSTFHETYEGRYHELRNSVIWGPRVILRADFSTKVGQSIGFRLGTFLNLNGVFVNNLYTGINPRFIQLFVGMTYCPSKQKAPIK